MAKATDKIQITLDSGASAEAQAPVIVSASRSTDIPAFYADWFFERLKRGYSAWTNPFHIDATDSLYSGLRIQGLYYGILIT